MKKRQNENLELQKKGTKITKKVKFYQFFEEGYQNPLKDTNSSNPQQKLWVGLQSTPNIKLTESAGVCITLMTGHSLIVLLD